MPIEAIKTLFIPGKNIYSLGNVDYINHVQIFENKGSVMGCSNPHPHGQI
jgi:UDPglucose--hexose-1-phosphate uridylyltransferase